MPLRVSARSRFIAVAAFVFLLADQWRTILRNIAPWIYEVYRELPAWGRIDAQFVVWIGLVLLGLAIVHRKGIGFMLEELGLRAGFVQPLSFGLIATLPMSIAFLATSPIDPELSIVSLFHLSIVSPFAEEVLYRGYLFRQLYRRAAIGFILSIVITAALFGIGHFNDALRDGGIWNAVGVLLITGLGGAFFAWLFVRWKDNLWVPFSMHFLMNFWWGVFAVDTSALGGWLANAARLLTVILAIVLTLYRDRIWKTAGGDAVSAEEPSSSDHN